MLRSQARELRDWVADFERPHPTFELLEGLVFRIPKFLFKIEAFENVLDLYEQAYPQHQEYKRLLKRLADPEPVPFTELEILSRRFQQSLIAPPPNDQLE